MTSFLKKQRGRPPKTQIAYDAETVKKFIERYFEIRREMNLLKEDEKELKEEYKNKINQKLVGKVVRLVKAKLALSEEEASSDTIGEIEEIVTDKVNMISG